jgi:hypothetical protein
MPMDVSRDESVNESTHVRGRATDVVVNMNAAVACRGCQAKAASSVCSSLSPRALSVS